MSEGCWRLRQLSLDWGRSGCQCPFYLTTECIGCEQSACEYNDAPLRAPGDRPPATTGDQPIVHWVQDGFINAMAGH